MQVRERARNRSSSTSQIDPLRPARGACAHRPGGPRCCRALPPLAGGGSSGSSGSSGRAIHNVITSLAAAPSSNPPPQPHKHTATQARMQLLRRPTQRHRARAGPAAGCVRAARWLHGSSCTRHQAAGLGRGQASRHTYRVIVSAEMRRGARESPSTRNASDPDQHPDPDPCSG